MAETQSPAEIAERLQKRRLTLMILFPILYLSQQGPFWLKMLTHSSFRLVDKVQISAYVAWALALLVLLATGGGLGRSQAVRDLLSDESTREHRAKAYVSGFWALILGCAGLCVASLFTPLSPPIILNALLTLGVVVPCATFAVLEYRAARD